MDISLSDITSTDSSPNDYIMITVLTDTNPSDIRPTNTGQNDLRPTDISQSDKN